MSFADAPEAREALLHDLRAVDEQAERPPHAHVVERGVVEPHAERRPRARLRRVDAEVVAPPDDGHLRERHVRHGLDLPGEERVHLRRVGREVDDPHLVEVRLAGEPVVLVLDVDALAAGREALDLERPRPDVLQRPLADRVRLVPLRDDALEVLRERLQERDVGARQREPARALVELLDPLEVDRAERRVAEQLQLRVLRALDRVDDVVDVERLAVVELDRRLGRG